MWQAIGISLVILLAAWYTWWLLTRCPSRYTDYGIHISHVRCVLRKGHPDPHTDGNIRWDDSSASPR